MHTKEFDYEKPEIFDFQSVVAAGKESCYPDCTVDDLCTTPGDDI